MSARLFKAGPACGVAFAPFTIPSRSEPVVEEFWEDRGGGATTAEVRAPQADLKEAEERVRWLLETAQSEAAALLAQTQTQVAQIEREACEKGLAEARAKIAEEINAAVADLREKLSHTLSELEPLYALIATRAERDLVKLALEIARKVVHREVATDPDIVLTLARVALERLHPRAVAKVRLHPEDLEYVITRRHEFSNTSALEFVADASVGRGGCLIQSEHGDIDARLEEQFASIERGFFQ
jgi:flagellar assembly protein FliH